MKIKKEMAVERKENEKRLRDKNRLVFRCPKTGNTCVINDPTPQQKEDVQKNKITCFDLVR
jgi:hypothetical protein